MPNPDQNSKLRNWLLLIVLAGFAALMYVSVVVKITKHGF